MFVLESGSTMDPRSKEGLARLTAKMLPEGTEKRSGPELASVLEGLGTSADAGADWDSSIVKATFLSKQLDQVLELLTEALLAPTFPERELQRLKAERVADLVQIESEPRALADQRFEEFLYAAESRYSVPSGGSKESVSGLAREDLVGFHHSRYSSRAMTVVAAGDFSTDKLRHRVSRLLTDRVMPSAVAPVSPNPVSSKEARIRIVERSRAPQSELRIGHGGLARRHPDYFPAVVMNAILGGLFGSRINLNLREAHGYTYGASSYFDWRKKSGPFVISTAVQTEVTAAALKEVFSEIERIRSEEVSLSELSLAKDYLDGVFPIRYETTAAIATALANAAIHGLPRDYYDTYRENIRNVSAVQVLDTARKHLRPESMQTVIVGDGSEVRDSVEALGLGFIDAVSG